MSDPEPSASVAGTLEGPPAQSVPGPLLTAVGPQALQQLGELEGEAFLARLELVYPNLAEPLRALYGQRTDVEALLADLVGVALAGAAARPSPLRVLDRRREVDQGWFQRTRMIGYACYVNRFAGTLAGVRDRLDYLAELGITYLHLMPLLAPREGPNDGGYAVADYGAVDPRLGTMADLEALAADLRERGIALCIDLPLNHTAREHRWARAAAAGDPAYRDFFLVFPDRTMPDAYERTLPEVFPHNAPGNFTFVPQLGWVWTTFNDYQWDLDYANPAVFRAMLGVMLDLANHGADVLRLDAVPFLWKRIGTDGKNQPEVHLLLQAFRALTQLAAPGLLLKAEAIVERENVTRYLGAHEDRYWPQCQLAYHNQLNIMLWSCLATRDVRLATRSLAHLRPAPAATSWVTYLRSHDDIGWAVSDADAASVGWDGFSHRRFLNDFFAGRHPGSFGRGLIYQKHAKTGDARVCGSAAALCGIEAALQACDRAELDAAVNRLEMLYSVVFSFGGIPVLWMGDELAQRNDRDWAQDPAHAEDNRWVHRPAMDWAAAARRHDRETCEGRVFAAIRRLVTARRSQPALQAGGETKLLTLDNPHVLAYRRRHPTSRPLVGLANFSDSCQSVDAGLIEAAGLGEPEHVHSTQGRLDIDAERIHLPAWGFAWLVATGGSTRTPNGSR
jgi:amylosucrase